MPNAKEVTAESEFLKCLIIGEPGTGKSIFASSFPTPGFLFDFSGGVITYRGLDFEYSQYPLSALGWSRFERDFSRVEKEVKEKKYETVIFDDCTGLIDIAMEQALRLDPKRSATDGPLWNVHYGMVANLLEGKFRRFITWPCNIVLIAHMDVEKNEDNSVIGIKPFISGRLAIRVPGYFDEVYYTSTRKSGDKIDFLLQTAPIGMKHARSRLSGKEGLIPYYVNNDYNELMKFITKKKKSESAKIASSD